jgi:hypothetical protein
MPAVDPNAPVDPNDKRGLNFAPGTGNPGLATTGMGMDETASLVGRPGLPAPRPPDAPSDSSFLPGDVYTPTPPVAPTPSPTGGTVQPKGSDQDNWLAFTTRLSGVQGFDAAAGRSGASQAAGDARGNLQGTVDAYNKEFGTNAKVAGGDRIDFTGQGGEGTDVIRDSGGGTNGFWWGGGDSGSGGGGGTGDGGGNGGGGGGGGSISSPTGSWTGTTPGQGSALYDALLKRSQQSLNVDPNDPIIRGQTDANNVQLNRERTQYLQQVAERGGSNANIGNEERSSAEQVGQAGADFQSKLMGQELAARRTEIQNALTGQAGLLTSEQQLQLQEELANLQRAESHYQFGASQQQQESQFGRNLGQQGYQFDSNDRFRNSPLGGA